MAWKLEVFLTLRRALRNELTDYDRSVPDAINDSLQLLSIVDASKTFLDSAKP